MSSAAVVIGALRVNYKAQTLRAQIWIYNKEINHIGMFYNAIIF